MQAKNEIVFSKALEKKEELGIKRVVIASNTGATIEQALNKFSNIVWVTHHFGYNKPNEFEYTPELRKKLERKGVKVLTTSHILSGAERGLSTMFKGYGPVEVMAQTLRMFGQGTKVALECSVMALDAGLIEENEMIIAIGGTGKGADSAIVITPAHASNILSTKIHEIICKPNFYKKI